MSIRIIIVDDHAIMLDGLEALLRQKDGLTLVAKTVNANYALAYLRKEHVDVLITDYSMPDMSGVDLIAEARKIKPELKVIVLSMHDEPHLVEEIIAAGADAYILKKYAHSEIIQAIDIVAVGGQYWSPEVNQILVRSLKKPQEPGMELSSRETEVLKLIILEMTTKEIAQKLFVSERTIETHRKNLLRKTNSKNTVGLIKYAYQNNIIS
jgi:two-component system, NarL family, nitrate/nitrite response regulator NarL